MKPLKIANLFWITILGVLIFLGVIFSYISIDAPYYLSIAEDLSNGLVLYKDIYSSYTPIMMYVNSIIPLLINDPNYKIYLILQFIVILCTGGIFYSIGNQLNANKYLSFFLSLSLVITLLSSDGIYIILEVYVIFFVLLAYLLLLRDRYLLCGLILACSFFTKQYGLLNYIPFLLIMLLDKKLAFRQYFLFFAGSIIPVAIFLSYFNVYQGVSLINLLQQLTRNGLTENMLELETSFITFLIGAKVFILLLFVLFFLKVKPLKNKIDGILIIGIIVNMIPLYIQSFAHYFILTYPFIFILFLNNFKSLKTKPFIIMNLVLILISSMLFSRIIKFKTEYVNQMSIAEEYRTAYPNGAKVFLYKGFRYLYILNNYKNPVLKEIGYRYEFYPNEEFRSKYDVISKD